MSSLNINRSIIVPAVTGYPMWDDTTTNYLCHCDVGIDAKAFALFYIYILWPDLNRESFQRQRQDCDFNGSPNGFILKIDEFPWNLPASKTERYKKWFPVSIFPNGTGFNEASIILHLQLRACYDQLVRDFFYKEHLILSKTTKYGLQFIAINDIFLVQKFVADQTKGI